MKRLVMFVLIALIGATSTATAQPQQNPSSQECSVRVFRDVAEKVYQPWHLQKTKEYRLHQLKVCAPNDRTRAGMNKAHRPLHKGRADAIHRYHALTPYVGLGARWAIPSYIVACESGGSWSAANPSGAIGAYQFLGWPVPWPVDSIEDKMDHHIQAGELSLSNWVCA